VKDRYAEFQRLESEVLVISFASPASVSDYVKETSMPFPVVSDPTRASYGAFGLGRTSWSEILRAGVVGRYLRLVLRGWLPGKTAKNDDLMQLGGDFVLNRERRLVFAHPSAEPTDRPSVDALLQAVQRAADSKGLR
jgi:hypothetical protein